MEVFVFLKTIDTPSTNAPKKLCHACNLLVPVQAKVVYHDWVFKYIWSRHRDAEKHQLCLGLKGGDLLSTVSS